MRKQRISPQESGWLPGMGPEKKESARRPEKKHKERLNDDLSFSCEVCMDSPGGCAQCGFGRNRKE